MNKLLPTAMPGASAPPNWTVLYVTVKPARFVLTMADILTFQDRKRYIAEMEPTPPPVQPPSPHPWDSWFRILNTMIAVANWLWPITMFLWLLFWFVMTLLAYYAHPGRVDELVNAATVAVVVGWVGLTILYGLFRGLIWIVYLCSDENAPGR